MKTITFLLVLTSAAWAQQPTSAKVSNARIETRASGGDLVRSFQSLVATQNEAAWAGYTVPIVEGQGQHCCWNCNNGNCCSGCALESRDGSRDGVLFNSAVPATPVKLEGPREMLVLFRVRLKAVEKIRTFTEDCQVDAGGLVVTLFTGVSAEQSVALLSTFVVTPAEKDERSRMDSAISAIGIHAGAAADQALESFVAPAQPEIVRDKASFWLGNARGQRGYLVLKRMADTDPSDAVRDKVTFALSQSKEPAAMQTLIEMAKNDKASRVRSQALFWLAQKAGRNAIASIDDAIANDPDTAVKKKAVFALSQLPKEDGVPKLIQVARTNTNPVVRKEAMFWLGQSKDQRAIAFFEEILAK